MRGEAVRARTTSSRQGRRPPRGYFGGMPRRRVLRILRRLDAVPVHAADDSQPITIQSPTGVRAVLRPGLLQREELAALVHELQLDWDDFLSMK